MLRPVALLLLTLLTFAHGQLNFAGSCNTEVNVVRQFNLTQYLGTWYEIYRYSQKDEVGLECVTANYKLFNASFVNVNNTGISKNKLFDRQGMATPLNANSDEAKLEVSFDDFKNRSPYWVLKTNYDSYALVYACRNLPNNTRAVTSWVLSRKPALLAEDAVAVNKYFDENAQLSSVLGWQYFNHTVQWGDTCRINGSSAAKSTAFLLILGTFLSKMLA